MSNIQPENWCLNPDIDFLNHGSFGATPRAVLEDQQLWRAALEADPIHFLAPERTLLPKLDLVRMQLAELIGCQANQLAFVRNATDGVNAVLRSFPFRANDEVLVTSHGYNACTNAVRYAVEQAGGITNVCELPFPCYDSAEIIGRIVDSFAESTRLLLIDHVTSPSAMILPIQDIVSEAHRRGIRVMVDGAHAPGMLDVDLESLGADYYTANHHKWLCGPKASGFLYVAQPWLEEVRPTVISHAMNRKWAGRTRFHSEFDWVGTYDPTPILSLSASFRFFEQQGGLASVIQHNHELILLAKEILCTALQTQPRVADEMLGSMLTVEFQQDVKLPSNETPMQDVHPLQQWLFEKEQIEVPVYSFQADDRLFFRVSAQLYNHADQYRRLAEVLQTILRT